MEIRSSKYTNQIVGSGFVALDVLLKHNEQNSLDSALGGSTGNVLAILAFLGWPTVPVAMVGHDFAGKRIKSEFDSLNADMRFLHTSQCVATPVVYQFPSEGTKTHNFSFTCPYCGVKRSFVTNDDLSLPNTVLTEVELPRVFYFDRVTPWTLNLSKEYKQRGTLVVFEPSSLKVDRGLFQQAIKNSHILKYADDRIDLLEGFDRSSLDIEIQTSGASGLRFRIPRSCETWYYQGALEINGVVDTAGAGDWCTAGFLHYLYQTDNFFNWSVPLIKEALTYGQTLAALNCLYPGARGLARSNNQKSIKAYLIDLLSRDFSMNQNELVLKDFYDKASPSFVLKIKLSIQSMHSIFQQKRHPPLCCQKLI